jgi:hypothetical protein
MERKGIGTPGNQMEDLQAHDHTPSHHTLSPVTCQMHKYGRNQKKVKADCPRDHLMISSQFTACDLALALFTYLFLCRR